LRFGVLRVLEDDVARAEVGIEGMEMQYHCTGLDDLAIAGQLSHDVPILSGATERLPVEKTNGQKRFSRETVKLAVQSFLPDPGLTGKKAFLPEIVGLPEVKRVIDLMKGRNDVILFDEGAHKQIECRFVCQDNIAMQSYYEGPRGPEHAVIVRGSQSEACGVTEQDVFVPSGGHCLFDDGNRVIFRGVIDNDQFVEVPGLLKKAGQCLSYRGCSVPHRHHDGDTVTGSISAAHRRHHRRPASARNCMQNRHGLSLPNIFKKT
jgi:hypothetical protein